MAHRYTQLALALPGAEARSYSPKGLELAPPEQGHLALDGGVLGPLFNQPTACIWWSPTRAAWGCQIGNERSWHYNEADAIKEGERLGAKVTSCSMFQVEA